MKNKILNSGLSISDRISVAWASGKTFRNSDLRGGANGARISLLPQKQWAANEPERLMRTLSILKSISSDFSISLADTIVLAGNTAIEEAASSAGFNINVPFNKGRGDATQEMTDIDSYLLLF